jgi:NADPH-dependent ferric siderophore reductase
MSTKGRLLRLFSGLLNEGTVTSVKELSPEFRLIRLQTPAGKLSAQPGDKVQLLLPSDDVRTYTPIEWNADGTTELLVYLHANTPGPRWAREVSAGQRIHFAGPQRSLPMPSGDLTLIGDETSLAVAASYVRSRPGQVRCIFEVASNVNVDSALHELQLTEAIVVRRAAGAPRGTELAKALPPTLGAVGLTGGAELIKLTRDALRARGVKDIKTKAYWVEGRVGLD